MNRWRKRPVVIEARQLTRTNGGEIAQWSGGVLRGGPSGGSKGGSVLIHTMEGDHRADVGDWIIRGIKGEFYPCKPDIFDATYEPASAPTNERVERLKNLLREARETMSCLDCSLENYTLDVCDNCKAIDEELGR